MGIQGGTRLPAPAITSAPTPTPAPGYSYTPCIHAVDLIINNSSYLLSLCIKLSMITVMH